MRSALWMVALGLAALLPEAEAAVGRIEADYGVTASGSPVYRIPIEVTEGIGGMTPQLAVSYAGPSARSILGVGFTLEGLSAITRCAKTLAQDGVAEAPVVVSTDRYCLGGARLRLVSGTYGASESIYRTELDAVARITAKASVNNIPGWFQVETRDGRIHEYGNSASSRLMQGVSPWQTPLIWSLNRIVDRSGNSIAILYDTDQTSRRHRPLQIDYTASNAGVARHRIVFQYPGTDRSDPVSEVLPTGTGGGGHLEARLLEKLLLQHDGVTYREYRFGYEAGAYLNSRLKTITECVPTNDCLPATTLQWQSATAGHGAAVTQPGIGVAMPLDINGDGYDDLVWSESGTWRISWGGPAGPGAPVNTGIAVYAGPQALPLDWNGDGRMDLLVPWSGNQWYVLVGTATGFATPVPAGPGSIPSNTASSDWLITDFNGDGRDDLLRMNTAGPMAIYARLNGPSGLGVESVVLTHDYLHHGGFQAKPAGTSPIRKPDFNGDGRTDITFYACEYDYEFGQCMAWGWYYAIASGNYYDVQANLPDATYSYQLSYGDFNADGLTDIVYPGQLSGVWRVAFGQGGGGLSIANGASTAGLELLTWVVADYDGDGYDDLHVKSAGGSPTWRVVRATGTGLATIALDTGLAVLAAVPRVGDFNGDGLPDLGASVSNTWSTFPHAGLPGERLSAAVDGLGNSVAFGYLPMTNGTVYSRGSGAVFPVRDHQSSSDLVRTMTVTPAGSPAYSLEYKYSGARVHLQGRGYLGMAAREIKDLRNGITTTETYEQDFPKSGLLATRTVRQPAPGSQPIESVANTYTVLTLDATPYNQRYLPYLSQSVRNTYEVGGPKNGLPITQTTDTRTVNGWGNTTSGSTTVVDQDTGSPWYGQSHVASVAATYSENPTSWCLALPTTRVETRTLPGGSSQSRLTHWTVDASASCRTTQEIVEPYAASDQSLTTDLGYDSCGNVSSVSRYPSGLPGQARTTTIGYGSRCHKPETVTNALGQATTYTWDYPRGGNTVETDPNGLATQREFDGFGRLTRERGPDLAGTRFVLGACDAGNSYCGDANLRYYVRQSARDTADGELRFAYRYYDGQGRIRYDETQALEGAVAVTRTNYDAFGRISQVSQPYFAGGTVYWVNYSYDLLGRPTQENAPVSQLEPSGRITGYAYEGRDRRITDPRGYTTTRSFDVLGQLRRVIDPSPGGTTTYTYWPFGELASITDAATNVTSWTVNVRGFVTATSDPDAGNWSYVPNAFGELVSQTDAKAQTVSYTYDPLGRPDQRVEPEGTTTWTWGAAGHNTPTAKYIGRLKSISSPGGYSETNTNDSLGRIVQQSLTIDGTTYQVNRSYSPTTGWPATLQYPTSTSGYRLQLAYDYQNGQLKRVRNSASGTTYWEAVSTNAWGKLQNESFGNGIASYTEYDPANGWLFKRQAGVGGGTGRIDAQVSWDRNGNFTTRQDLKQSLTETFVYDPLNRLDYSQRNGVTNLDVTLDAIGNVTWKSDVGTFTYHATKRRAVVSAGSNTYDYDANGNMRTRNGSTINYASYNLPTSIASGANSSTLAYGAWRNTVKQVAVTSGTTETTVYVAGLLEKVTKGTTTEYRHRIDATPGTVAIYVRKSSGSNATYYLHRDHLGSPEMITNASGNSVVKLSFSAYGERRDVDWDGPITNSHLTSASNVTRHGYTDHLHLDSVKLVHMGGRVYDPVIGRFLSRDPYIDGVQSSQGANGYAYVWNNPLTRWDPTGYAGTRDGMDYRSWPIDGIESIVVTASRLYWAILSHLSSGSIDGGTGGESGGGGSGGGGDSGPEGPKDEKEEEPEPTKCSNLDSGDIKKMLPRKSASRQIVDGFDSYFDGLGWSLTMFAAKEGWLGPEIGAQSRQIERTMAAGMVAVNQDPQQARSAAAAALQTYPWQIGGRLGTAYLLTRSIQGGTGLGLLTGAAAAQGSLAHLAFDAGESGISPEAIVLAAFAGETCRP